ncbi:kinase-like protein, partial [Trifolium pratense]
MVAVSAILGNQTDHFALLKFKESIISNDPYGTLESWNSSIHFCKWRGITCNLMHQRVIGLNLEGHELHGSLSPHVGNLSLLKNLNLQNNSFYGEIPQELDISENHLSGDIPTTIGECISLEYLYLQGNSFNGTIPSSFASLKEHLNVSFNMLDGEVPTNGVFGNASQVEMIGNNKLCGGISLMHLPPCPIKAKISYQELHQGTDGFSPTNLIGSGSFGSVYKANLVSEDHVVAVKVLNLQKKGSHKSFIVE